MNYRKELKAFEVKEAERVEALKQKSAENQRKKLLKDQVSNFECLNMFSPCAEKRNDPDGGED